MINEGGNLADVGPSPPCHNFPADNPKQPLVTSCDKGSAVSKLVNCSTAPAVENLEILSDSPCIAPKPVQIGLIDTSDDSKNVVFNAVDDSVNVQFEPQNSSKLSKNVKNEAISGDFHPDEANLEILSVLVPNSPEKGSIGIIDTTNDSKVEMFIPEKAEINLNEAVENPSNSSNFQVNARAEPLNGPATSPNQVSTCEFDSTSSSFLENIDSFTMPLSNSNASAASTVPSPVHSFDSTSSSFMTSVNAFCGAASLEASNLATCSAEWMDTKRVKWSYEAVSKMSIPCPPLASSLATAPAQLSLPAPQQALPAVKLFGELPGCGCLRYERCSLCCWSEKQETAIPVNKLWDHLVSLTQHCVGRAGKRRAEQVSFSNAFTNYDLRKSGVLDISAKLKKVRISCDDNPDAEVAFNLGQASSTSTDVGSNLDASDSVVYVNGEVGSCASGPSNA